MRGPSVHLAPAGAFGILMGQFVLSSTSIENESRLPSGDQATADGDCSTRVTCEVAPSASIQRTNTCDPFGSPAATYAMRSPDGDHFAPEPFTRKRLRLPSTFMIHSADSRRSVILPIHPRVYMICVP